MIIIKVLFLLGLIIFIAPLVFFLLIGIVGKYFSLTIDKNSWLAKNDFPLIKNLIRKNQ